MHHNAQQGKTWTAQTWRNKGFLLPLHSFEWFRIEKQMFHIMLLHHMCWCEIFLHTVHSDLPVIISILSSASFGFLSHCFLSLVCFVCLQSDFSNVCLSVPVSPVNHSAASSKPCSFSHSPPAGSGLSCGYICLMAQSPFCLAPGSIFKHQPFGGACSPSASAGFSPGSMASFLIPKTCTLGGFKWTPNCL